MAEGDSNVSLKTDEKRPEERAQALQERRPFESLRREIDRLFDDFGQSFWRSPFRSLGDLESLWSRVPSWRGSPAVDIVEGENAYELTAELPGMDENNIELQVTNGGLKIKGEKKEQKEEKRKDYYLSERRYGSFERFFPLPQGVDADKIEASFKNGVLTVTVPKKPDAQKPEKKIDIKPG
jgi:HSP20 family protein